ncbi:PASTA domain-containing protein [Porphyromonas loveana]|uniref:PASTA domain-containing protein n=1 Tax=Porphyromonas loveana TaxID=1884669 RepID=UPI0035A08C33
MQLKNFYRKHPIISTLLLVIAASIFIFVGTMFALDIYTRHNSSIIMPELRGKGLKEAERLLAEHDLRYEIVDSVYDASLAPGVVVEMVPSSGNTVKPGRIIFLSITARDARKGIIPDLKDMSGRQAMAVLKGLGFERITERYVSGDYVNLTDGVELADGRSVPAGTRLPITTPLVLRIVNGYGPLLGDSLLIDESTPYGAQADSLGEKNEDEHSETWW